MTIRLLLAVATLGAVLAADASDADWRQVSDFAPSGLFADGARVIAWDQLRYAISTDGGVSWSNPIAPVSGATATPVPLRSAVVANDAFWLLTATGTLMSATVTAATPAPVPPVAAIAVDGAGMLYTEGIDSVIAVVGGAPMPTTRGRIYRALKSGVLVQLGSGTLTLATPAGPAPAKFAGERLPPVMDLAPLTTRGGDRWATTAGATWLFTNGTASAFGERQARVAAYGFGSDGYHELIDWKGPQITFLQGRTGLAGHPRTRHLPHDAQMLTIAGDNFIVATAAGIWYVPIAP